MEKKAKLTETAASAASSVLDNDDLLGEILLRLEFPTCLVRAATVCKRWLRHASDPAFLRRFRERHPPHLLGIYLRAMFFTFIYEPEPHPSELFHGTVFVTMPQPPEYAAVIRRSRFELGRSVGLWHCRNGRAALSSKYGKGRVALFSPLHPWRGTTALPHHPLPKPARFGRCASSRRHVLLPEDGSDDGVACIAVTYIMSSTGHKVRAHISELLQATGAWSKGRTSDWMELPPQTEKRSLPPLLAHGKLFLVCMPGYVIGLDPGPPSMSLFCIKLPEGVEYSENHTMNIALCRAECAGFFLVHATGSRICVWIHTTGCTSGSWQMVDSICLHQVFGTFNLSRDSAFRVVAAGDNADFVFLEVESKILYIHIRSRAVEMVFEAPKCMSDFTVHPFMMVWPPTFPAWSNGCDLVVE